MVCTTTTRDRLGRVYGTHPLAEHLVRFTVGTMLIWDIPTLLMHGPDLLLLAHHAGVVGVCFGLFLRGRWMYYALYLLGVCETSSVFLCVVETFNERRRPKWHAWLREGEWMARRLPSLSGRIRGHIRRVPLCGLPWDFLSSRTTVEWKPSTSPQLTPYFRCHRSCGVYRAAIVVDYESCCVHLAPRHAARACCVTMLCVRCSIHTSYDSEVAACAGGGGGVVADAQTGLGVKVVAECKGRVHERLVQAAMPQDAHRHEGVGRVAPLEEAQRHAGVDAAQAVDTLDPRPRGIEAARQRPLGNAATSPCWSVARRAAARAAAPMRAPRTPRAPAWGPRTSRPRRAAWPARRNGARTAHRP